MADHHILQDHLLTKPRPVHALQHTDRQPIFQCCGSGMFIPDPDFLLIPDPGSKNLNKRERWKKICCHTFFCSHKFLKIENYFYLCNADEKNLAQFSKNYRTFYPKINLFRIPDPGPGVKKSIFCTVHCSLNCLRSNWSEDAGNEQVLQVQNQRPLHWSAVTWSRMTPWSNDILLCYRYRYSLSFGMNLIMLKRVLVLMCHKQIPHVSFILLGGSGRAKMASKKTCSGFSVFEAEHFLWRGWNLLLQPERSENKHMEFIIFSKLQSTVTFFQF